jgi:hypothetical protein
MATFLPAQPRCAMAHLVPGKAAAREEAKRTLRYVEPLRFTATNKRHTCEHRWRTFFSIL